MRILCLTFGDSTQGSAFYRIHQYIPLLAKRGIQLEAIRAREFDAWDTLSHYDGVLLQKSLLPLAKLRRLRRHSRRFLYDVDDAVWQPHGQKHFFLTNLRQNLRLKFIARAADLCMAANSILADHLRSLTAKVVIVPMALDETIWTQRANAPAQSRVRFGWAGHPVNLPYLWEIEPALAAVQQKHPATEFVIFSGADPQFSRLRYEFVPYQPAEEPGIIGTFDVGLLPLPADTFAQGKSPIKALQYMATGIPTVLAPVGAAAKMFEDEKTALFARDISQWTTALERLATDPSLRMRLGKQTRVTFENTYTLSRTLPRLAEILSG